MTIRLSIPRIRWPTSRISIFGLTLGISMVGMLTMLYFRQRSKRRGLKKDESVRPEIFVAGQIHPSTARSGFTSTSYRGSTRSRTAGSVSSRASTMRSSRRSVVRSAADSHQGESEEAEITPEDCGVYGLKALRQVIDSLEDALYDFKQFDEHFSTPPDYSETADGKRAQDMESSSTKEYVTAPMDHSFALMQDLKKLLQEAYIVRERWKQKLILQADMSDVSDLYNERELGYDDEEETESFVSASEFIDLSDLEALLSQTPAAERYLYRTGLLEIEQGNISCRSLRTRLLGCETDSEYLAKVHCLRLAFDNMFANHNRRTWAKKVPRAMAGKFLESLGYNPDRFYTAFDEMMDFIETADSRIIMSEELGARGVKCINFYDITFDYMLLDAFEELDDPPSSLVSVIGNRWLSDGFKKTALESAVWTILLAKRKLLKHPSGFISHYYSITSEIGPALAWGFLGPEEELTSMCRDFKNELMMFAQNMFSFSKVRYTTVDELSDDVYALFKEFAENMQLKFTTIGC